MIYFPMQLISDFISREIGCVVRKENRKYHIHRLQTKSRHHEEEAKGIVNNTVARVQTALFLPEQDYCKPKQVKFVELVPPDKGLFTDKSKSQN